MLRHSQAFSSYSVDDVQKVKTFYGETLGLDLDIQLMGTFEMLNLHLTGGGEVLIYPKGDDHQPAAHTVLNFPVDDIEAAVDQLTQAGVQIDVDQSGIETDERGISKGEGPRVAWFKDPAGNTLAVMQLPEAG